MAIESPFCQNLLNFNVTNQGLSLRRGDYLHANLGNNNAYTHQAIAPYGSSKLIECAYNATTNKIDFFDVDAGTVLHSTAASGTAEFKPLYFNNRLFFFTDAAAYAPGIYYDGAAFGTIGYSGSGLSPFGGNVYKERAYIIERGEPAYWYSDIAAITGALTKVDLVTLVSEKTELAIIAKFTLSDQVSAVELQAFCMFNGEILFYSGSYPNSSDWSIAGRAKVSQIVNYHAGVQYQGDYLILTDSGVVSLRDLFLKGSEAAKNLSVNSRINKTWASYISLYRENISNYGVLPGFCAVWDTVNSRVIINMPLQLVPGEGSGFDVGSGNTQFVFFSESTAWGMHRSFDTDAPVITDFVVYKGIVYHARSGVTTKIKIYRKEYSDHFDALSSGSSNGIGYDFQVTSAPISRSSSFLKKIEGVDLIIAADCYDYLAVSLPTNFNPPTTSQKAQGTPEISVEVPFFNIGAIGNFIQWDVSGTSKISNGDYGLELYGVNIWTSQGGSPR
jgi:hypothetical protein